MTPSAVSLRALNTLAIDAKAPDFKAVKTVDDLATWRAGEAGKTFLVLGGGSNVVFTRDPACSVLHMCNKMFFVEERADDCLVTAGAGHDWHSFVDRCIEAGFYGLENLALIPGTVGASPIQNIGAYGVEMRDHFHSLSAWDADRGQCIIMTAEDCAFAYRDSVFKTDAGRRLVVLDVTFRLSRQPKVNTSYGEIMSTLDVMGVSNPSPRDVFSAVCKIRREKLPDPILLPNVGSFFKNPILDAKVSSMFLERFPFAPCYPLADGRLKVAAGWLIDQCGWKGRRIGHVSVHDRQALVLINHNGPGQEVLAFADMIRSDVLERYGIPLEIEPTVV